MTGLGIQVDLEAVVLDTRVHLFRKTALVDSGRGKLADLLPTVQDFSICTSTQGPFCLLTGNRSKKALSLNPSNILLDGVVFPAAALADWDTLFSNTP